MLDASVFKVLVMTSHMIIKVIRGLTAVIINPISIDNVMLIDKRISMLCTACLLPLLTPSQSELCLLESKIVKNNRIFKTLEIWTGGGLWRSGKSSQSEGRQKVLPSIGDVCIFSGITHWKKPSKSNQQKSHVQVMQIKTTRNLMHQMNVPVVHLFICTHVCRFVVFTTLLKGQSALADKIAIVSGKIQGQILL